MHKVFQTQKLLTCDMKTNSDILECGVIEIDFCFQHFYCKINVT